MKKMEMKRRSKSIISLVMSLLLVVALVAPMTAFAGSGDGDTGLGASTVDLAGADGSDGEGEAAPAGADAEKTAGPVDGIIVEVNGVKTGQTVTFNGGKLSQTEAPEVTGQIEENYIYAGTYIEIGGNADNRHLLTWLGTVDGKVCYDVEGQTSEAPADNKINPSLVSVKADNDSLVLAFTTPVEPKYDVTYTIGTLKQIDLSDLGGGAKMVKQIDQIADGQVGYFQVERTPGTTLEVSAKNTTDGTSATVTKITNGENSSGNTSLVETYMLSGTKGPVAVTITPKWTTTSYNVNLNITSASLQDVPSSYRDGRIRIMQVVKKGIAGNYNDSNPYEQVMYNEADGNGKLSLTKEETIALADSDALSNSSIRWYYVTNSVGYKDNGNNDGWRQRLSAIVVNGESVSLPEAFTNDTSKATAVTYLQEGESRGTKVTIKNYDVESSDKGQNHIDDIQRYDIEISNIHTDIKVQMVYSPVGTQGVIWTDYIYGVDPELFINLDYGDKYVGWRAPTVGAYLYQKYSKTAEGVGVPYRVRWKNKQGYYKSRMIFNYNGVQKVFLTSDSVNATPLGDDGYYTTALENSISNGTSASLTFTANLLTYTVKYDGKDGTYSGGIPTDSVVYDVVEKNRILVSPQVPEREGYKFLGYKIKNEKNGTIFQPGTLIDLSDTTKDDLSALSIDSKGNTEILLEAQWQAKEDVKSLSTVKVISKKLVAKDTYVDEEKLFVVAAGAKYTVTADTDAGDDWAYVKGDNLEGIAGQTTSNPQLYYQHPTSITYTDDMEGRKGDPPAEKKTLAYNTENLSDTPLTKDTDTEGTAVDVTDPDTGAITSTNTVTKKTEYKHIGWMDQQGKDYLFADADSLKNVEVPWAGLQLIGKWEVTVTTTTEDIVAEDFSITQDQLTEYLAADSEGKNTLLKTWANAHAETWDETPIGTTPKTTVPEAVKGVALDKAIDESAKTNGGTYLVTFTSEKETSETVRARVLPSEDARIFITAESFSMTLAQAKAYTLWNQKSKLIDYATAQAWIMTGDVKSEIKDGIKVDNSTIKAAAGIYTVTFSTDAIGELSGEKDTVIALVLPEHLTAQDFTVKVKDVEDGLSDQILMEKAQVQAWNGDDQTNLVENVGVDKNQSDEIKAAAGQYKLTFTTPAGTQKTVTVTVESPSSPYTPVTPTVVPGTTPDPNPGDTPIDTDNPGGEGGTQIEKLDSSKDEVNKVIVPDSESKVPRTGDNDIIFLWIFLILLSGIVGCAAALTTDEKAPRQGRNRRFFRKNKKN